MTKILKIFITFMLAMFIGIVNVFAYEVGDIIEFGKWPAGAEAEDIEWEILEKKNDGTAIILSSKVIDTKPYNTEQKDITWAESSLRRWLNGEFYSNAFTPKEKDAIVEARLKNLDNNEVFTQAYIDWWKKWGYYSEGDEERYLGKRMNGKGGVDTTDNVWLLSLDDMKRYGRRFSTNASRIGKPTEYLKKKVSYCTSEKCKELGLVGNAWWWLRSPGYYLYNAAYVNSDGFVYADGFLVAEENGGVRAALKINLNNLESTDVASIEQNTNKNAVRRRRTNEITVIQSSKSNVGTQENKTLKKPVKKSAVADGLANIKIPSARRKNSYGIAVIIGAKDYDSGINPVAYAHNDAAAVKNFVIKTLGYDEENIIYAENPTKGKLEQIFGTKDDYKMQLHNWIKPGKSDVFIYYAGHGAPDQKSQTAYFVPKDADPDYIRVGGYSMETLYSNLAKLPARSITVVTDVCFSGQDGSGKMIIKSASPLAVSAKIPVAATGTNSKITVFNASKGSEMASWYDAKQHGLFTYYFLLGISGEADKDKNKTITAGELDEYLQEQVPYRALRLYNREQHPMFIGNSSAPIAEYK